MNKLIVLQKIDKEIYDLKVLKAKIPEDIQELTQEFELKKATLKNLEDHKQKLQIKQKEKEVSLGSIEETIKKIHSQLGALKTNKEYQAKLTEIETLKADKSIIEEEILRSMDEIEEAKKNVEQEKSEVAKEEKGFQAKKNELDEKTKVVEQRIGKLESERSVLKPCVDKTLLDRYEYVLQARSGVALVPVKDNSCQGCFLKVPHQVVNEIKMHDKLISCESCARILYLEEDVQS